MEPLERDPSSSSQPLPPLSNHPLPPPLPGTGVPPAKKRGFSFWLLIFLMISALGFMGVGLVGYALLKSVNSGSTKIISSLSDSTLSKVGETVVTAGDSGKKIALIKITGIIYPGDSLMFDHTSSEQIIMQLRKAMNDARVVALILDMNTPGGSVTATDEIHNELQKVRKKGIKVITCMRTVGASGGYYLAAGTDYVIANRLTLTGSVGVIIGGYNYHGLFEKIGVESEIYKSGQFKDILNMARLRQDAETQLVQSLVNETFLEFAKIVSQGRRIPIDEILTGPIGDARIMSGKMAYDIGLVDQLGYLEDAIERAKAMANVQNPTIIRYYPHYSLTDILLSSSFRFFEGLIPGRSPMVKNGLLYYLCPTAL